MDVRRRDFLTGVLHPRNLALACTGSTAWLQTANEVRGTAFSLRPPCAREEQDFLEACSGCGQCVEACPFETLSLAQVGDEAATEAPRFEARQEPCHMCEDVPCVASCPTDALEKDVSIEDARMGLAVLTDKEACLAFKGQRCEVCYRACPMMGEAIELDFRPKERTGKHASLLPIIHSDRCTGCGMCEHACILKKPAIRVLPREGEDGELDRFGWENAHIRHDFTAPTLPPEIPGWEGGMDRILEQLEDLTGVEDP